MPFSKSMGCRSRSIPNGEPFASAVSLSRLTNLAVFFIEHRITPVYSDPGHPEHNPGHERMHRDLKAAATHPVAYSLGRQQMKFDEFRHEHNEVRPHQSLDKHTPQEPYYRSARNYEKEAEPWKYLDDFVVKYVCRNGAIRWGGGKWVVVSSTLIERYVGLELIAEKKCECTIAMFSSGIWTKKSCAFWTTRAGCIAQRKKCKRC
jgi:hypothetical protein